MRKHIKNPILRILLTILIFIGLYLLYAALVTLYQMVPVGVFWVLWALQLAGSGAGIAVHYKRKRANTGWLALALGLFLLLPLPYRFQWQLGMDLVRYLSISLQTMLCLGYLYWEEGISWLGNSRERWLLLFTVGGAALWLYLLAHLNGLLVDTPFVMPPLENMGSQAFAATNSGGVIAFFAGLPVVLLLFGILLKELLKRKRPMLLTAAGIGFLGVMLTAAALYLHASVLLLYPGLLLAALAVGLGWIQTMDEDFG